jgi:hypothetical protein
VPLDEVRAWFDNNDRDLAKVCNLIMLLRVMQVGVHVNLQHGRSQRPYTFYPYVLFIALMLRCWLVASIKLV